MSNLKKFLTPQGAQALRDFAATMPAAVENIIQSTDKLINTYRSTSENLGTHSDSFSEMLDYIRKAQEKVAEAIEELPKGLETTASKIDVYLAKNSSVLKDGITNIPNPVEIATNSSTKIEEVINKQNVHRNILSSKFLCIKAIQDDLKQSGEIISEEKAEKIFNGIRDFSGLYSTDIRNAYINPRMNEDDTETLKALDEYLQYAPKWEGKIYRGINVSPKVAKAILSKDDVDMLGPSSWSSEEHVAQRFSYGKEKVRMVFVLDNNKSGSSITHLSTYDGIESEVLSPSGVKYKILDYTKCNIDGINYVYVNVSE